MQVDLGLLCGPFQWSPRAVKYPSCTVPTRPADTRFWSVGFPLSSMNLQWTRALHHIEQGQAENVFKKE